MSSIALLLVEDDPLVARSIERALHHAGYVVTTAPSVTAALACTGPFDLGVFDIYLPDGSGLEVADQLLRDSRVDRAIFYSATTDERMWIRARDGGHFVHKREGVQRLLEVVEEVAPGSTR